MCRGPSPRCEPATPIATRSCSLGSRPVFVRARCVRSAARGQAPISSGTTARCSFAARTRGSEVMESTKTGRDQVIDLDPEQVAVLRWHVERLERENKRRDCRAPDIAAAQRGSELLFPAAPTRWSHGGGFARSRALIGCSTRSPRSSSSATRSRLAARVARSRTSRVPRASAASSPGRSAGTQRPRCNATTRRGSGRLA
jgi:hypothetical protein